VLWVYGDAIRPGNGKTDAQKPPGTLRNVKSAPRMALRRL
jgi:hypothetical protein